MTLMTPMMMMIIIMMNINIVINNYNNHNNNDNYNRYNNHNNNNNIIRMIMIIVIIIIIIIIMKIVMRTSSQHQLLGISMLEGTKPPPCGRMHLIPMKADARFRKLGYLKMHVFVLVSFLAVMSFPKAI